MAVPKWVIVGGLVAAATGIYFGSKQYDAARNAWRIEFKSAYESTVPTLDRIQSLTQDPNLTIAEALKKSEDIRTELSAARSKILGLQLPDGDEPKRFRNAADHLYKLGDLLLVKLQSALRIDLKTRIAQGAIDSSEEAMKSANEGISRSTSYEYGQMYSNQWDQADEKYKAAWREREAATEEGKRVIAQGLQVAKDFHSTKASLEALIASKPPSIFP